LKLLVIADDLSGATDVGVQFAGRRIKAIVLRYSYISQLSNAFRDHQVVLIDMETRHLPPSEAAERVRTLTTAARELGIQHFYKKTDSTLRGNIGAELQALLRASDQKHLCFVPAHPLLGRTTRGGIQYVDGKPLHETEFARDPRNPMADSDVLNILGRQTSLPINIITQAALPRFRARPVDGISVFDAESVPELKQVVAALNEVSCLNLLAGPAALASLLPDLLPFETSDSDHLNLNPPFLLVNGSLNQVALDQCAYAADHGFLHFKMSAEDLFSALANEASVRTHDLLRQGQNVLFCTVCDRMELPKFEREASSLGLSPSDLADAVAAGTGRFIRLLLELRNKRDSGPLSLIVIGGDTLAGIAQANDWSGFVPHTEILPGVALCTVPQVEGIAVITKPGGFGSIDFTSQLIGSLS